MNRLAPPTLVTVVVAVLVPIVLFSGCSCSSEVVSDTENTAGGGAGEGRAAGEGEDPADSGGTPDTSVGTCRVELRIELDGLNVDGISIEGRQVELLPVGRDDASATLGRCDASGRVYGEVPAWAEARVRVAFVGNIAVVHPEVVIPLTPGGDVSREVRFEVASARLEFPGGVVFPDSGSLRLAFRPGEGQIGPSDVQVSLKDGDLQWPIPGLRESDSGVLTLGALPVGTYEVNVRIIDKNGEFREVVLEDGTGAWEPTPSFERTVHVELRVGETATVTL